MNRQETRAARKRKQRRPAQGAVDGSARSVRTLSWFWLVFAAAFVLRLIYLWQIEAIPLFYHLAGDGRTYDEWAQRISRGDWLGQGVFYQAPLYPYFLGLLQVVFGHNLWLIRLLQIMLGSFACALIYRVGEKLFSRAAGIAAGLVLACYAPAIFFDGLIEKSVLDVALLTLLVFILFNYDMTSHWAKWLAAGAVLGLLGLSRENALILVPVVAVWFWFQVAQQRVRGLSLFFAGLLLVLFPVGLRNLLIGGEFKLTTSQFGPNFYIGNNPAADGSYGSIRKIIHETQLEGPDAKRLAERALGRALSGGEVSGYWSGQALDFIKAQPAAWLRLMGLKSLLVWNGREVEDSDDFYIYQNWSWLLAGIAWFSHFGVLAPLAAVGVLVTIRQWRQLWLLYATILSLAASVAAFYIFGRYRYPLVPLLALFAGAGIVETFQLLRQREWRQLAQALIVLIGVGLVSNWPLQKNSRASAAGYNNLANAYAKQGKVDEAIKNAERALAVEPDYGVAYYNLGNLHVQRGEFDLAKKNFETVLELLPNFAEAHSNYGQLLAQRDDVEAGVAQFEKAIALNPTLGRAYFNLGVALVKQGKVAAAIGPLKEAARWNGGSPQPSFYLGSVYAAQHRYGDAEAAFNQALSIDAGFVPAHQSLAQLLALQGKGAAAQRHYQAALELMRQSGAGR
ncbi:MAG: tetratricopeptide repeat protein [Deltaproteobacteria bacterium]|nr:tetratricopeptide repeat protein [Deltaproteobacteria bacterium]